jgi:hypothetical protein
MDEENETQNPQNEELVMADDLPDDEEFGIDTPDQPSAEMETKPVSVSSEPAAIVDLNQHSQSDSVDMRVSGIYYVPDILTFNPNAAPFVMVVNPASWDDVAVVQAVSAQLQHPLIANDKQMYSKLIEIIASATRQSPAAIRAALSSPEGLENWAASIGRSVKNIATQSTVVDDQHVEWEIDSDSDDITPVPEDPQDTPAEQAEMSGAN